MLAISVNGDTWDLTRPIHSDASIVLHKWDEEEAKHAFGIHRSPHGRSREGFIGVKLGIAKH